MPVSFFIRSFKVTLANIFGLVGFSAILIALSKNFLSVNKRATGSATPVANPAYFIPASGFVAIAEAAPI
jgi:hypothetical protein